MITFIIISFVLVCTILAYAIVRSGQDSHHVTIPPDEEDDLFIEETRYYEEQL